ncbi:MAG TPA: ribonucleotide-diphosphate reductase subunit alpha [Candidatus Omnitrophica bacterium]|nr:ribonucleotide-diphosphate reductase subunit alpha [Candidatus Omnitrophota bacterium]
MKLSDNSLRVLEKRYLKKDENGKVVETPHEMFSRVAKTIAAADRIFKKPEDVVARLEKDFYDMMAGLEFMPNSPTLMNAGRDLSQLSACFVLPIDDSMESIFDSIKATALIHKSGGGTGFSFSRLRSKASVVKSTGGMASGPISFMKVFDAATQAVKQGGTRRGANMGILRVDHPDIMDFIVCKENDKEINNFNISVAITEDFMKHVVNNEEYELIDPSTKKVVRKINAKTVFDLMVKMAHKNGEPGIVFIDRINNDNPTPNIGKIESTNPCGEQPLLPFESCNLGSINLYALLKKNAAEKLEIDWDNLKRIIHLAVHFLDNVIEVNKYPLAEIDKMTKQTRKVGLGVMGWASALAKMMIPYDSDEALALAEKLMSFIHTEARIESLELAKERGTFPAFKGSIYDKESGLKLRNATLTTIAPTGTISIIAGPCSSGIEPMFAISYYRSNVLDNDKMIEIEPAFKEVMEERGLYSRKLMEKIAEKGSIHDIEEVPVEIRRAFMTAHDISPEWHIKMQSVFQKYTDNAVSKTVNFHQDATIDDVRNAYMLAYEQGCKGVTIYRDKSRDEQVLNIGSKEPAKAAVKASEVKIGPRPRPEVVMGTTTKVSTGCGNLYVTINTDEHNTPFEVFTQMGKAGGCAASQLEAIGRLVSLAFRSGVDVKVITEQLRGIRCPSPSWEKGARIFSCADAIARVVERRLVNDKIEAKVSADTAAEAEDILNQVSKSEEQLEEHITGNIVGVCPDCGGAVRHEEGCVKCSACGYTKC